MTGSPKPSPRWHRFVTETGTIVFGILLALAANAGYQHLVDRASEREILRSLRLEFAADVTELQSDQRSRQHKLAGIDQLRAVRSGAAETPAPEALAQDLLVLLEYRFYTASHPVLDDLLTTGRLDLIRSDELRQALMVFGQARSRIGVVEQREREFVASQFEPYLGARLDLEVLDSGAGAVLAAALDSAAALFAEEGFGSLLYLDRKRTQASLEFGDILLEQVLAVQRILGTDP